MKEKIMPMVEQYLILAAGNGSRLVSRSSSIPKGTWNAAVGAHHNHWPGWQQSVDLSLVTQVPQTTAVKAFWSDSRTAKKTKAC